MKMLRGEFVNPYPDLIGHKILLRTVMSFIGMNFGGIPMYETQCECGEVHQESYEDLFKKKPSCKICMSPTNKADFDTMLTPREEALCQEYILCGNHKEAAKKISMAGAEASKVMRRPRVRDRIEVLLKEHRQRLEEARVKVADRYQIDLERITRMLLHDREAALTGRVHLEGREPEPIPANWRMDLGAAAKMTLGLAQLHGLMIKRTELTVIDRFEKMNDYEIVDFIGDLQSKLADVITIDASPISGLLTEYDGQEDTDGSEE